MEFCPHHVRSALENPHLAVRPEGQQVPEYLQGTGVENVFSHLVRMNDGPEQVAMKRAITATLERLNDREIQRISDHAGQRLVSTFQHPVRASDITHFCYALPICVIADVLGYPDSFWETLIPDVLDFVRCIAPGPTAEQIEKGGAATARLLDSIPTKSPLLTLLQAAFVENAADQLHLRANILGLFFQACEGTAGLMGQSLLLAQEGESNRQALIESVLLVSPPIRNTRRFALRDTDVKGCPFEKGQMLVLPLENGNAFGQGAHACPGERWAKIIADSGLSQLLALSGIHAATGHYRWRESQNARVPEFFTPTEEDHQ